METAKQDGGDGREETSQPQKLPANISPQAKRLYLSEPFVKGSFTVEVGGSVTEDVFREQIEQLGGNLLSLRNRIAHMEIEAQMLLDVSSLNGVIYIETGGAIGPATDTPSVDAPKAEDYLT